MGYKLGALIDIDEFLVNNRFHLFKTYNEVREHFGMEHLPEDEMLRRVSADYQEFVKDMGLDSPEKFAYLSCTWDKNLKSNKYGIRLYDGALDFLKDLSEISSVVLVTGSHTHQIKIYNEMFGLGNGYKVLTKDDVIKSKPHPEHLIAGMEAAGSEPESTIVADDMPDTLLAAKRLGMYPIGNSWGLTPKEKLESAGAVVVNSFDELLEEIERFQKQMFKGK